MKRLLGAFNDFFSWISPLHFSFAHRHLGAFIMFGLLDYSQSLQTLTLALLVFRALDIITRTYNCQSNTRGDMYVGITLTILIYN
jgi:hypothetical protein